MDLVSSPATIQLFEKSYDDCTIRYGDMKKQLAEDMVEFISPIRLKAASIQEDKSYLKKIMEMGADKARESAANTMQLVRDAMGLNY
jgi:tryptophanyl-tRNA synthetase